MDNLRFAVVGYQGRMGKLVQQVLKERGEEVSGLIDKVEWQDPDLVDDILRRTDVAICFTDPSVGFETTKKILQEGVNAVVGTTKFYNGSDGKLNQAMIDQLAEVAEINGSSLLYASNFSTGVNLWFKQLAESAPIMAKLGYRPMIFEAHHGGKKDSPSGSAVTAAKKILPAYPGMELYLEQDKPIRTILEDPTILMLDAPLGLSGGDESNQVRDFIARAGENRIPIVGIRTSGDKPVGTHYALFVKGTDVHAFGTIVQDRAIFAREGITHAYWLAEQPKGRIYTMEERLKQ